MQKACVTGRDVNAQCECLLFSVLFATLCIEFNSSFLTKAVAGVERERGCHWVPKAVLPKEIVAYIPHQIV